MALLLPVALAAVPVSTARRLLGKLLRAPWHPAACGDILEALADLVDFGLVGTNGA
jgi:hypothetical protein